MSNYLMLINGGTTNTRFALLRDGAVIAKIKRNVGAATTKDSTRNVELENTVRAAIEGFEATHGCRIAAAVASGMITSNVGLKEISHLDAPVTFDMLVDNVKPHVLADISGDMPIYMVPGVRFHMDSDSLESKDLMRGEETEILGALRPGDMDKTVLFLHLGSHGKAILYREGAIRDSVTTFGGELLWAVCHNTILQSSVSDLNDFEIQPAYVEKGYEICDRQGLTRTLFLSRIANISEGRTPEEVTSFVFGALTYCDLKSFLPLMEHNTDQIVIYGRDSYIKAAAICIERFHPRFRDKLRVIDFLNSENLAIQGMYRIYQKTCEKRIE